jgi:hypothetical protein
MYPQDTMGIAGQALRPLVSDEAAVVLDVLSADVY